MSLREHLPSVSVVAIAEVCWISATKEVPGGGCVELEQRSFSGASIAVCGAKEIWRRVVRKKGEEPLGGGPVVGTSGTFGA